MWLSFIVAVCVACVVFELPGILFLKLAGLDTRWTLPLAPIASMCIYILLSLCYDMASIPCNPVTEIIVPSVVLLVLAISLRSKTGSITMPHLSMWALVVCLVLGLGFGWLVFARRLPSPDASVQLWDMQTHLNLVQAFVDSSRFDILHSSVYLSPADQAINPLGASGFYPASWHAVCALVAQSAGCPATVAINAVNYVVCSLIYPMGMVSLLAKIFDGDSRLQVAGTVAAVTFIDFPWGLLTWGPVYPNILGFALIPASAVFMTSCIDDDRQKSDRSWLLLLSLASLVVLALAQPNAVFAAGILFAFYTGSHILRSSRTFKLGPARISSAAAMILWFLLCAAIWLACYKAPMLQDIVRYTWPSYADKTQALANLLTCSYTYRFRVIAAQPVIAVLIGAGAVRVLRERRNRWLLALYAFSCCIMFVVSCSEGTLRHVLSGFWYTDPARIAAMTAIFAVPLAALGTDWTIRLAVAICNGDSGQRRPSGIRIGKLKIAWPPVVPLLTILALVFVPVALGHPFDIAGYGRVTPAYRIACDQTVWATTDAIMLTPKEQEFCDKARNLIGSDALVINNPTDGSAFAYGTSDLRTYYRRFSITPDKETRDSKLLRERLADMASDSEVSAAVKDVGASYVLQLEPENDFNSLQPGTDNHYGDWSGINAINSSTRGFRLVMSEGPYRLYQIDDQYTK